MNTGQNKKKKSKTPNSLRFFVIMIWQCSTNEKKNHTCKIPEPESLLVHWWICCLQLLVCRCCPGACRVRPGGEQWRRLSSPHPGDKPEHYWKQPIRTVVRVNHRKLNAVGHDVSKGHFCPKSIKLMPMNIN